MRALMRFAVSFFNHAKDNQPRRLDLTLDDMEERLTRRPGAARTVHKTKVPAWSPAIYEDGATRAKRNALSLSCVVLDYDSGTRWPDASRRWEDWRHIVHSSWSYGLTRDEEVGGYAPLTDKFRIVLPLAHPVEAADWPRVFAWAFERDPHIDPSCKDASRIYFLPCLRDADAPWVGYVEKAPKLLDLREVELPELQKRAPPRSTPRVELAPIEGKQEQQDRLNNDPGIRLDAAGRLQARLIGGGAGQKATSIECPGCGRPEVWFWINPEKARQARCNHEKSCGWTGWLDQLLGIEWTR